MMHQLAHSEMVTWSNSASVLSISVRGMTYTTLYLFQAVLVTGCQCENRLLLIYRRYFGVANDFFLIVVRE